MNVIIKDLLLKYNNDITSKISIKQVNNNVYLRFTLLDMQKFAGIVMDEMLELYNDYLNFEYAQFGLNEQDIEEFKKYLKRLK